MAAKKHKPEKAKKDKGKKEGKSKAKVIRDSFTIPEDDYQLIKTLKQRCLGMGISIKKSELLRAGLHALQEMKDAQLGAMAGRIEKVKTGRPAAADSEDAASKDEASE